MAAGVSVLGPTVERPSLGNGNGDGNGNGNGNGDPRRPEGGRPGGAQAFG